MNRPAPISPDMAKLLNGISPLPQLGRRFVKMLAEGTRANLAALGLA